MCLKLINHENVKYLYQYPTKLHKYIEVFLIIMVIILFLKLNLTIQTIFEDQQQKVCGIFKDNLNT